MPTRQTTGSPTVQPLRLTRAAIVSRRIAAGSYWGVLAHACLQTSCWDVQLSGHDAVLVMPLFRIGATCPMIGATCPNACGGTASAGPAAKQLFWQLMAALSQPLAHNVAFSPEINGVTASGVGVV